MYVTSVNAFIKKAIERGRLSYQFLCNLKACVCGRACILHSCSAIQELAMVSTKISRLSKMSSKTLCLYAMLAKHQLPRLAACLMPLATMPLCCKNASAATQRVMSVLQPSVPAKKGEPCHDASNGPPQPTGPRQPWWTGVMDRRFVMSFEPLASFTKSLVNAGGTKLSLKL